MKENKNVVFGLRSFKKIESDSNFEPDGYLLFPDEPKAMEFLDMCEHINKRGKTCHYEKFTWVKVSDYIGDRINQQKQFYVAQAEAYVPTEADFKVNSKNVATKTTELEEDKIEAKI